MSSRRVHLWRPRRPTTLKDLRGRICLGLSLCLGCAGTHGRGAGPRVDAGAAEADAASDAACEGDPCDPLESGVLAAGQGQPGVMVMDDTNVYWANGAPPAILKCAKTGCSGAPTVLAQGDWPYVHRLVLSGGDLYWGGDSRIYKCAATGCGGVPTVFPAAGLVVDLAVSARGDLFYVASVRNGFVSTNQLNECSASHCDGGPIVNFVSSTSNILPGTSVTPSAIAVDAQKLYVQSKGEVGVSECDLDACWNAAAFPIGSFGGGDPPLLVVDTSNVYASSPGAIQVGPKDGGVAPDGSIANPPRTLLTALGNLAGLAVDDTTVYFADLGVADSNGVVPAGAGRIGKCAIAGCDNIPENVRDYVSAPGGLAVDDASVYWTEQGETGDAATGRVLLHPK